MSRVLYFPVGNMPVVKFVSSVKDIIKIFKTNDLIHESLGDLTVYHLANADENTHELNTLSHKLKYTKIYGDAVIAGVDEAVELFDLTAEEIRKFTITNEKESNIYEKKN